MKNKYEVRGDEIVIFLNRKDGTVIETRIDPDDFEKVNSFPNTWVAQYHEPTKKFYVKGNVGNNRNRRAIHLHRLITACPEGLVVDHINWDPLDNRKANLRVLKQSENLKHKIKIYSDEKGIYPRGEKFSAFVNLQGKQMYVGVFKSKEEAKIAIEMFKNTGVSAKKKRRGSIGWHKGNKRWQARMTVDGVQKHLGLFLKKEDAEVALNNALNVV